MEHFFSSAIEKLKSSIESVQQGLPDGVPDEFIIVYLFKRQAHKMRLICIR